MVRAVGVHPWGALCRGCCSTNEEGLVEEAAFTCEPGDAAGEGTGGLSRWVCAGEGRRGLSGGLCWVSGFSHLAKAVHSDWLVPWGQVRTCW